MEQPVHSLPGLFSQLGLPDSSEDIDAFIEEHQPLPKAMSLAEAPFWTEAQAAFIHQALNEDADWAEVVDELNTRLR